jgi:hypothetical protein
MSFCTRVPHDFKEKKANEYAIKLCEKFGEPDLVERNSMGAVVSGTWLAVAHNHDRLHVVDEAIQHASPMPHEDFVYSTKSYMLPDGTCPLTLDTISKAKEASASIMVDQLKCTATARCGATVKNDVTLHFLDSLVGGTYPKKGNTADHYAHKIAINAIKPENEHFIESLGEKDMALMPELAKELCEKKKIVCL